MEEKKEIIAPFQCSQSQGEKNLRFDLVVFHKVEVVLCTMDSDSTFPSSLRSIDGNDIFLFEFDEVHSPKTLNLFSKKPKTQGSLRGQNGIPQAKGCCG
jgi:hypothetical protein